MQRATRVRYLITTLAVLLLVGGLVMLKAAQLNLLVASGKQAAQQGPPPESVGTARAKSAEWDQTIEAVGSAASSKGIVVTTEVPGAVTRIAFQSGQLVKAGEVLVELDASIERAALASAIAERDLAVQTAERSKELAGRGSLAAATLDEDRARLQAAEANTARLQAELRKKVVRAPFAGRLGIRSVSLGQYLTPGTPIATLESVDEAFVDFTVPQQRLGDVTEGTPVRIELAGNAKQIDGVIAAIDPSIEERTRSVQVRARVPDVRAELRAGMFVDVTVVLPQRETLVIVPMTAIVHAPYGDSVFIVEDKPADSPGMRETPDGKPVRIARQQFVQTGRRRGDYVAVMRGLQAGREVVISGAFKLRNNAPVVVTDAAVPRAELSPQPENR